MRNLIFLELQKKKRNISTCRLLLPRQFHMNFKYGKTNGNNLRCYFITLRVTVAVTKFCIDKEDFWLAATYPPKTGPFPLFLDSCFILCNLLLINSNFCELYTPWKSLNKKVIFHSSQCHLVDRKSCWTVPLEGLMYN